MTEEWRGIAGYENKYQVSSMGRVRSIDHETAVKTSRAEWTLHAKGKVLSPIKGSNGYLYVGLTNGQGKTIRTLVHFLVAQAFLGPRPDGLDICHIDGNCYNNSSTNLRYDSRHQNNLDVYRNGGKYGKLTPDQVYEIKKQLSENIPLKDIAAKYQVHPTSIYNLRKGKYFAWLK